MHVALAPTIKADVLIEALPYIKRFHHLTVVVKVGGAALEEPAVRDQLLLDLVWFEQVGLRPILVHGGGKSITRAMAEAHQPVTWHEGRRVTDAPTMAIVHREVERLNAQLVDRLIDLGGAAIGLVPPRHPLVRSVPLDPALGLVGRPVGVERERLLRYSSRGLIPVVPPLSTTADGQVVNTNADDIALVVAEGMRAEKLVFLSDVPGICRDPADPTTRFSSLTVAEVTGLIRDGIITGGMIPKVQSCLGALAAGVHKIHIIDAGTEHALLLEVFTKEGIGTELVAG
jgi:acetylglutamate kinase